MDNFYKITKEEADLIGRIMYSQCQMFDPYCGETEDGFYLIEDSVYELLKDREEFKKIDFLSKTKINKEDIQLKSSIII